MVTPASRFASFIVEVPVERWRLYLNRFLLLFFVLPAIAAMFELPRVTVVRVFTEGFLIALTFSAVSWWMERPNTKL